MSDPLTRNRAKELAVRGETALLGWATIPSGFPAEAMAAAGFDAVLVDMQHGLVGHGEMVAMVTAITGRGIPAFVRPPVGDIGMIGRGLDAGAVGIVCPMIESADDAEKLVRESKYPPVGRRSWGPARQRAVLDADAYRPAEANAAVLTMAMIETGTAVEALDGILEVEGIDAVFVGPNDLSLSLTGGRRDVEDERVVAAMARVVEAARRHGKFAGAFANTPEIARAYRADGFPLIAIGTDIGYLQAGARSVVGAARVGS